MKSRPIGVSGNRPAWPHIFQELIPPEVCRCHAEREEMFWNTTTLMRIPKVSTSSVRSSSPRRFADGHLRGEFKEAER